MFRPPVLSAGAISILLTGHTPEGFSLVPQLQHTTNSSISSSIDDTEYVILENIYDSGAHMTNIRQRDLAQIAGTSLGMTNSILKRLAQKGWITVKKLNSRNIQYAVTIDGINEIMHRSYRYFKRTIKNVVYFKEILENLVHQACQKNMDTVVLVGKSDLDFIIEHSCHRCGLSFKKAANFETASEYGSMQALKIFSENIGEPSDIYEDKANSFYLSRLIIRQAAAMEKNQQEILREK